MVRGGSGILIVAARINDWVVLLGKLALRCMKGVRIGFKSLGRMNRLVGSSYSGIGTSYLLLAALMTCPGACRRRFNG